jgi:uncharacterized repeat protein (TIGR01451 family)
MRFFKITESIRLARCVNVPALLLLSTAYAHAAITPSGVTIQNQATASFTLGNSPIATVSSNLVQFSVDKLVNVLVTESTGIATLITPGQPSAITTFRVTNLGNDAQDFSLTPAAASGNPANNSTPPFTANDFSATGLVAYVDANNNNTYEPSIDIATTITNLGPGSAKTVFVLGNIPNTISNGQQSVIGLSATAAALGGAALTPSLGADTPMSIDTVFADAAGVVDAPRDAIHSAYAAYLAASAHVSITKTIASVKTASGSTINNPASGDPALRPGATLTYRITLSFLGTGTVNNLAIADPLPSNTSYVPNSIKLNGLAQTDAPDSDAAQFDSNSSAISLALGSVNTSTTSPATDIVIQFDALIN